MVARGGAAGPDSGFQRASWISLGARAVSQKSVRILTPYVLPNDILRHALEVCALRGVARFDEGSVKPGPGSWS